MKIYLKCASDAGPMLPPARTPRRMPENSHSGAFRAAASLDRGTVDILLRPEQRAGEGPAGTAWELLPWSRS